MAVRAPLEKVLALCDPRAQWPWDCQAPTASELQALLVSAPEVAHPITGMGTAELHIGRVRQLVIPAAYREDFSTKGVGNA